MTRDAEQQVDKIDIREHLASGDEGLDAQIHPQMRVRELNGASGSWRRFMGDPETRIMG